MTRQKFRVYLAGPISGCNHSQRHKWRDEVKQKYGKVMDFIDPAEDSKMTSYEIVKTDIEYIEAADGLLVNMWRESMGSAIGIAHAYRVGQPVVIANPNHLNTSILGFYATATDETSIKAAKVLLGILRAEATWKVIKSGDREDEPFRRDKLMNALREACRSAKQKNPVVPALVLSKVIDRLTKRQLTTRAINEAVLASLAELESTPAYEPDVKGISTHWLRRQKNKGRGKRPLNGDAEPVSQNEVIIAGSKSHATIWGEAVKNLRDIPSADARRAFAVIWEVVGITQISLGPFSGGEERSSFGAFVGPSKQPSIIDGKLFDKGKKGTMQAFQVRVQHARGRANVLAGIIAKLKHANCWAG